MVRKTQRFAVLLGSLTCALFAAERARCAPPSAASYVRSLDLKALERSERSLPGQERERVRLYMEAAKRDVLAVTDGCYPVKGAGVQCRNLAERAKGAAVLSSFSDYWPEELRTRCRRQATQWVREVTEEFRSDPNFTNPWQAAHWAAEAAIAAWFMWEELDEELQEAVAEMVVYQADRFIGVKPKMNHKGNTQAETVSWNSSISTLATNMMPEHPRCGAWSDAAKTYVYNTFATPQDARDQTIGDDGKPVKDWIAGVNIHEDFGLENHGQFHVDYIFACYRFHVQGAALYWLTGRPLPRAFHHHVRDVFERVMLRCMNENRFFVYVSDNDWRRYHNWTESCVLHAYLGLMEQHQLAYTLEAQALRNAIRYWRSFPEGFNYDNPYVCGRAWTSRIADAVLLHVTCPRQRPQPLTDEAVTSQLCGTSELESAQLVTHYSSDGSFRSYGRGRGPLWVRFVAPRTDSWMLLPTGLNFGASDDGKPLFQGGRVHSSRGRDWFCVVRHNEGGDAAEAFVSLPDEFIVFVERLPAAIFADAAQVENAVTIEKPHCQFALYFDGGTAVHEPGTETWHRNDEAGEPVVRGGWVNLQDRLGFVCRFPGDDSEPQILLPDAGQRSSLRFRSRVQPGRDRRTCMLVCPNQGHTSTRRTASELTISEKGAVTILRWGGYVIAVNLSMATAEIPRLLPNDIARVELNPWQVAAWRNGSRLF